MKLVDVFPEYKEILKIVSLIFFGIVIGILISRFSKDEVELKEFSLRDFFPYFYYGLLGAIFLIILIFMIQLEDKDKVSTLTGWLSTIGGFIVASVIFNFHNIFSSKSGVSIDDKFILAENYKHEKNYSRSLYYYESIKNSLDEGDVRIEQIEIKMNLIKSLQLNREIERKEIEE
ncbi:hypothetical protein [Maribacter dokdonensis]|uniref:hypothetical protein n=1 Tax=Maribacter dokdonensis TaxID=320912 RepID=UPI002AB2F60F|nr:hypothetical protein [Maribacter dokdonensis]